MKMRPRRVDVDRCSFGFKHPGHRFAGLGEHVEAPLVFRRFIAAATKKKINRLKHDVDHRRHVQLVERRVFLDVDGHSCPAFRTQAGVRIDSSGLGKIGVLVAIESTGDSAKLQALGKQMAMHVAAANPQSLSITEVDPAHSSASAHPDRAGHGLRPPATSSKRWSKAVPRKYLRGSGPARAALRRRRREPGLGRGRKASKEIGAPVTIAGSVVSPWRRHRDEGRATSRPKWRRTGPEIVDAGRPMVYDL